MYRQASTPLSETKRQMREDLAFSRTSTENETQNVQKQPMPTVYPRPPYPLAPDLIIHGVAVVPTVNMGPVLYRRTIALNDCTGLGRGPGETVLQRFVPTSREQKRQMEETAAEGRRLLDAVHAKACPEYGCSHTIGDDEEVRKQYEFGGIYHTGEPYLSQQTAQNYDNKSNRVNKRGRSAVADFSDWLLDYTDRFVRPLIEDPVLKGNFRSQLLERINDHFPWADKQTPGLSEICQPFYSTFTPAKGFDTPAEHTDGDNRQQASRSTLLNFGQRARLELTEYNCAIELKPFDIVFYAAGKLKVKSVKHPEDWEAGTDAGERWSVLLYFLQAYQRRQLPSDDILAMVRERKRKRVDPDSSSSIKREEDDEDSGGAGSSSSSNSSHDNVGEAGGGQHASVASAGRARGRARGGVRPRGRGRGRGRGRARA